MKKWILSAALVAGLSLSAAASYDNSWYIADFWSGEYANGFSVVKKDVTVPARAEMSVDAPANLECALPFKAVFHPWNFKGNEKRNAEYITASKIVPMTVKEDFVFETYDNELIEMKKGDLVEYLIYGAEGMFFIRYNGVEYEADQDFLEKVEENIEEESHQDEWLKLTCENGVNGWILLSDMFGADEEFLPGLSDWSRGFVEYGSVRDLTDRDLTENGK